MCLTVYRYIVDCVCVSLCAGIQFTVYVSHCVLVYSLLYMCLNVYWYIVHCICVSMCTDYIVYCIYVSLCNGIQFTVYMSHCVLVYSLLYMCLTVCWYTVYCVSVLLFTCISLTVLLYYRTGPELFTK